MSWVLIWWNGLCCVVQDVLVLKSWCKFELQSSMNNAWDFMVGGTSVKVLHRYCNPYSEAHSIFFLQILWGCLSFSSTFHIYLTYCILMIKQWLIPCHISCQILPSFSRLVTHVHMLIYKDDDDDAEILRMLFFLIYTSHLNIQSDV